MGHWVRADEKRCALCVHPRVQGETHIFIVVSVTCMKSLPCSFVETTSVTMAKNTEQARFALLRPHLCVMQGISLPQEQLTSFSKSSGKSCWEKRSVSIFQGPSKWCWIHSWCIWLQNILPDCHRTVSVPHIFNEFNSFIVGCWKASCGASATIWPAIHFLERSVNAVHYIIFSLTGTCLHCIATGKYACC